MNSSDQATGEISDSYWSVRDASFFPKVDELRIGFDVQVVQQESEDTARNGHSVFCHQVEIDTRVAALLDCSEFLGTQWTYCVIERTGIFIRHVHVDRVTDTLRGNDGRDQPIAFGRVEIGLGDDLVVGGRNHFHHVVTGGQAHVFHRVGVAEVGHEVAFECIAAIEQPLFHLV